MDRGFREAAAKLAMEKEIYPAPEPIEESQSDVTGDDTAVKPNSAETASSEPAKENTTSRRHGLLAYTRNYPAQQSRNQYYPPQIQSYPPQHHGGFNPYQRQQPYPPQQPYQPHLYSEQGHGHFPSPHNMPPQEEQRQKVPCPPHPPHRQLEPGLPPDQKHKKPPSKKQQQQQQQNDGKEERRKQPSEDTAGERIIHEIDEEGQEKTITDLVTEDCGGPVDIEGADPIAALDDALNSRVTDSGDTSQNGTSSSPMNSVSLHSNEESAEQRRRSISPDRTPPPDSLIANEVNSEYNFFSFI